MKWKEYTYKILLIVIFLLVIIVISDIVTSIIAKNKIIGKQEIIPEKKVGLVLGTGKYLSNGKINLFYLYRIEATSSLYKNGKIKKVLVSGDNSKSDYDEPNEFKTDLVKLGVPEENIYLDFAGFRTLDSIVRAKEIFGVDDFIIISQKSHIERALVLAKFKGIHAIGYPAKDVPVSISLRVWIRERLARVKMWLDLATFKGPKFLGKKEFIN